MASLARECLSAVAKNRKSEMELEDWEEESETAPKLLAAVQEFAHYIRVDQNAIPNYGDRYRHGEMISTSFVESAVNQVISNAW